MKMATPPPFWLHFLYFYSYINSLDVERFALNRQIYNKKLYLHNIFFLSYNCFKLENSKSSKLKKLYLLKTSYFANLIFYCRFAYSMRSLRREN